MLKETIMLPIRLILHPTDFSEQSGVAFQLACSLARDHGARLLVLHVTEPPRAIVMEGVAMPPPELDLASIRQRLEQVRSGDSAVPIEHRLVEGDSAREILRVAVETKCGLIAMGTHGRTGLSRLLMGSVAEQVVRKASCPVLTVKTPLAAPLPSSEAGTASVGSAVTAST